MPVWLLLFALASDIASASTTFPRVVTNDKVFTFTSQEKCVAAGESLLKAREVYRAECVEVPPR
jgi:hypothetical protein